VIETICWIRLTPANLHALTLEIKPFI